MFSNVISVAVTLTFMLALEWRLTILTLLVLPAFVIPAKRMGKKLQRLTRESMQLNALMNNTIAERNETTQTFTSSSTTLKQTDNGSAPTATGNQIVQDVNLISVRGARPEASHAWTIVPNTSIGRLALESRSLTWLECMAPHQVRDRRTKPACNQVTRAAGEGGYADFVGRPAGKGRHRSREAEGQEVDPGRSPPSPSSGWFRSTRVRSALCVEARDRARAGKL